MVDLNTRQGKEALDRWITREPEYDERCDFDGCEERLVLINGVWKCPIHDKG